MARIARIAMAQVRATETRRARVRSEEWPNAMPRKCPRPPRRANDCSPYGLPFSCRPELNPPRRHRARPQRIRRVGPLTPAAAERRAAHQHTTHVRRSARPRLAGFGSENPHGRRFSAMRTRSGHAISPRPCNPPTISARARQDPTSPSICRRRARTARARISRPTLPSIGCA